VTVSDGNGLQIEATKGSGNDVFEAGVEVIATAVSSSQRRTAAVKRIGRSLGVRYDAGTIAVSVNGPSRALVKLIALDGRVVATQWSRAGRARLSVPAPGAYLVAVDGHTIRPIHVR
jgi:hypothetical protein